MILRFFRTSCLSDELLRHSIASPSSEGRTFQEPGSYDTKRLVNFIEDRRTFAAMLNLNFLGSLFLDQVLIFADCLLYCSSPRSGLKMYIVS